MECRKTTTLATTAGINTVSNPVEVMAPSINRDPVDLEVRDPVVEVSNTAALTTTKTSHLVGIISHQDTMHRHQVVSTSSREVTLVTGTRVLVEVATISLGRVLEGLTSLSLEVMISANLAVGLVLRDKLLQALPELRLDMIKVEVVALRAIIRAGHLTLELQISTTSLNRLRTMVLVNTTANLHSVKMIKNPAMAAEINGRALERVRGRVMAIALGKVMAKVKTRVSVRGKAMTIIRNRNMVIIKRRQALETLKGRVLVIITVRATATIRDKVMGRVRVIIRVMVTTPGRVTETTPNRTTETRPSKATETTRDKVTVTRPARVTVTTPDRATDHHRGKVTVTPKNPAMVILKDKVTETTIAKGTETVKGTATPRVGHMTRRKMPGPRLTASSLRTSLTTPATPPRLNMALTQSRRI